MLRSVGTRHFPDLLRKKITRKVDPDQNWRWASDQLFVKQDFH